jgi:hypothetical protein
MSRSVIEFPAQGGESKVMGSEVSLPEPRIWTPEHLARFLGVSISWVYKRTSEKADDPIPRVRGVGRLRFDTYSPAFLSWIARQLDDVDNGEADE